MTEPDDYRFGARNCRVCGREVTGGACECAVEALLVAGDALKSEAQQEVRIGSGHLLDAIEMWTSAASRVREFPR